MINLTANPKQADFIKSTSNIALVAAGEQSGKTIAAAYKTIINAYMLDGYKEEHRKQKKLYKVLICEPTIKQVKLVAWPMVISIIEELTEHARWPLLLEKNLSDKVLLMQSKDPYIKIQFIFSSYESTEGKIEGLDSVFLAWLDEIFQCPENFYDQVNSRVAIANGKIICTGSVKADELVWIRDRIIKPAQTDPYYSFHTWWSEHNPYWSKEKIIQLKKSLPPKVFNRRYRASLTQMEGQVFDMIQEEITFKDFDIDLNQYNRIYAGMDFGFGDNPGTIVVVGHRINDEEKDDTIDVLFEVYQTGVRIVPQELGEDAWITRLLSLYDRKDKGKGFFEYCQSLGVSVKPYTKEKVDTGHFFNAVDMVYCDPAEPEYIASINRASIRCKPAKNARKPGFEWLMTLFTPIENKVRLRIHKTNCPNLIKEVQLLHYNKRTEDIVKELDHAVDALRYVLYTMLIEGRYHSILRNEYVGLHVI